MSNRPRVACPPDQQNDLALRRQPGTWIDLGRIEHVGRYCVAPCPGLLDEIEPEGIAITLRIADQDFFDHLSSRDRYAAETYWFPGVQTILLKENSTRLDRLDSFLHELGHAILGHGAQGSIDQDEHGPLTEWADAAAALFAAALFAAALFAAALFAAALFAAALFAAALFAVALMPHEPIQRSWHRKALPRLADHLSRSTSYAPSTPPEMPY